MGKLESTQKKRNSFWSEAYHIVYQTLWTQCYAMTTCDCQWKWVTSVCDDVIEVAVQGCTCRSDSEKCCKIYWKCFTVQMANDREHSEKATQEPLKENKLDILYWPSQSPDLSSTEELFSFRSHRVPENNLLQAVTDCKWLLQKYWKQHIFRSLFK